jgi:type IV pilus assembly protein PilQ
VKITQIRSEALEGKVRVTIESSDNLSYTAFTLSDPLRLVLDLPNAQLKFKEPITVNKGAVLTINPIQLPKEGNRVNSRIEIELSKQVRYQVSTDHNKLYVDLQDGIEEAAVRPPEEAVQPPETPPTQTAPTEIAPPAPETEASKSKPAEVEPSEGKPTESKPAETEKAAPVIMSKPSAPEVKLSTIKEIEVSQLPKETRVTINSDTLPEYEVKKESEPPRIVLDLKKSKIAPEAQKITDVHLTPSILKRISSFQLKRGLEGADNLVRVILNLTQAVDPQIKTEDGKIIIDMVHPTPVAQAPPTAKPEGGKVEELEAPSSELPTAQAPSIRTPQTTEEAKYRGQPITLDFKDADIRDVLRIIAEINDFNLVLHPEVSGRVTVRLINVPWDQALDIILKLNNLAVEIEGNIMRVGSSTSFQREIEAKRLEQEQRLAALETQKKLEPLRTEIITLNFADPAQIVTVIEGVIAGRREGQPAGPRRGTITVDARTKTLIVQDTEENIRLIRELVTKLDKRTPQILIEARIVTVSKQFSKSLGINWAGSFNADAAHGNTTGFRFPNSINGNFAVNLPLGASVGSTGIRLGSIDDVFSLDLNLAAAETEGLATILSQPKVVTVDNKAASIQTGVTFTLATTILVNNTTQTTLQQVNATLSLNVTPRVSADGHILMTVSAQNNSPDFASPITTAGGVPPINTQSVNTEVLVKDGETVVLGGILQTDSRRNLTAVPYLHKIPIIGRVFRSTIPNSKNQTELLIFITPKLLNAATVEQSEAGNVRQLSAQ